LVKGYTVVGLEQTSQSTPLPRFRFPERCVLLVGREREGVPPEILALLDEAVEIPQLGIIRWEG
jgi:tRNA guanosine-2'-O-methyltransferase